MSRQINQPINQVRLTNVAVVRCNKAGKRFEIACYKNKIMDYRAGLEKDLSEVLQTDRIFTNVSKGKFANQKDLQAAFGTHDEEAIAKIILVEGNSLQVSDLERHQQLQNTTSQIATWVASNCVHPDDSDSDTNRGGGRPYTVSQIKHALTSNGFTVHSTRNKAIKKQYLDAVKFLKTVMPIERAKMELTLEFDDDSNNKRESDVEPVLQRIPHRLVPEKSSTGTNTTTTTTTTTTTIICLQVDPSHYRELDELAKRVGGRLEILQQVVAQQEGDVDLVEKQEIMERRSNSNNNNNKQQQQSASSSTTATTTLQQQQQSQSRAAAVLHSDDDGDDKDEEDVRLAEKLQQVRLKAAGGGDEEDHDNDDDDDDDQPMSSKKSLRKAQKKSKKTKRREREQEQQQAEREEQEQRRQEEEEEEEQDSSNVAATNEGAVNASTAEQQQQQQQQEAQTNSVGESGGDDGAAAIKSCNTCGGSFANAAAYRAHFRSDWHRFNQKLKLKGIAAVSEQEFELCDADEFFGRPTD